MSYPIAPRSNLSQTLLTKVAVPIGFMALGLLLGYIQGRKAVSK